MMGDDRLSPGWLAEQMRGALLWGAEREAKAAHQALRREVERGQAIIDAARSRVAAADAALADAELAVRTRRPFVGVENGPDPCPRGAAGEGGT